MPGSTTIAFEAHAERSGAGGSNGEGPLSCGVRGRFYALPARRRRGVRFARDRGGNVPQLSRSLRSPSSTAMAASRPSRSRPKPYNAEPPPLVDGWQAATRPSLRVLPVVRLRASTRPRDGVTKPSLFRATGGVRQAADRGAVVARAASAARPSHLDRSRPRERHIVVRKNRRHQARLAETRTASRTKGGAMGAGQIGRKESAGAT